MPIKYLIVAVISILLSACVATYKAAEDGVAGYRELRIDNNTYYVEYTESARVSWERIHEFVLKRCAEIASENGYQYFDVLAKDEKEVFLKSDVDQITIASMGGIANQQPVSHTYQHDARVEGRRVTYKIQLMRE
ncbi:MAG: hypothetical protein R3183_11375 [Oleiphilaceae bacterium]|nr:hypothetical protein [Oleiphilaceae bacterium]